MRFRNAVTALLVCIVCVSALSAQSGAPCPRPASKSFALGSTTVIRDAGPFPCRLQINETGVKLSADVAGKVSGIGRSVARDSKGRYYTNASSAITVWSPDGKVLRTFGREGPGPGEFARGDLFLYLDSADNLIVRDNRLTFSVFSPEGTFLRTDHANGMGIDPRYLKFIGPLTALSSEVPRGIRPNSKPSYFTLFDFSGKARAAAPTLNLDRPAVIKEFGAIPTEEFTIQRVDLQRPLTEPVNGDFWVGPPATAGRGYEIQLWNVDGTLKRTIRRDVPWYKSGTDLPEKISSEERAMGQPLKSPRAPTPSAMVALQPDGHGLLYVVLRTTNDKWDGMIAPDIDRDKYTAMLAKAIDIHVEVIDVNAGVVLTSESVSTADALAGNKILGSWFGSGWSGYQMSEGNDGLAQVKMADMKLVKK